jgi:hypothetical protein
MENNNTGILSVLNSISSVRKLDISELPTQGHFYPKDFLISIKKATFEDILEYNFNYIKDDLASVIFETKRIIKNNVITNYSYNDIKSNDILYIFFEIVKFTMDRDILISYVDFDKSIVNVPFNKDTFDYFDYKSLGCKYNKKSREFIKYDYKFSLPSVGAENCLIEYIHKMDIMGERNDYNYDFLFFLGNKNYLSSDEIENLITIFNYEMNSVESSKIGNIVVDLSSAIPYSIKTKHGVLSLDYLKIDFETLFI